MISHSEKNLIKGYKINLTKPNFFKPYKQIIYHDSPIFTITYYAQWCLVKKISEEGYKVSISGAGTDEIFSGYYDHHNAYLHFMKNSYNEQYNNLKCWKNEVGKYVRNPFLKVQIIFLILIIKNAFI